MNVQTRDKKNPETRNQKLARWGEKLAGNIMREKGLIIIAANTHTPYGEVDLIVSDDAGIRFVEVKTRSSQAFGRPEAAIDMRKMKHMQQSAAWYIQTHPEVEQNWQIDVFAILVDPKNWNEHQVEWFENVSS